MTNEKKGKGAFVFRIKKYKRRSIKLALEKNRIFAGWSKTDLTNPKLKFSDFKEIIQKSYNYKPEETNRISQNAGNIWRIIREINIGDYVIVPDSANFYVCEVTGHVVYDKEALDYDGSHQREVKWLNNKQPIPRNRAPAKLQLRMKAHHTCVRASEFISDIDEILKDPDATFDDVLERKLIQVTHKELISGKMNEWDLERLVKRIIDKLTNTDSIIIPRKVDKGADIITTVSIADIGEYILAVQVKHHDQANDFTKNNVVDQLIDGMNAESAIIGWVVTTGKFADDIHEYKTRKEEELGLKIELIDGIRLAGIIIYNGISILD